MRLVLLVTCSRVWKCDRGRDRALNSAVHEVVGLRPERLLAAFVPLSEEVSRY